MKNFTYADIKSWNPCYDPIEYLPENWSGTTVDILKNEDIPLQDRLWCVLRTELINEKVMRLFAVWSYRQTLKFLPNQDPRSIKAADVAERFALGEASQEELNAAASAADSAAESAARSAAWNAARSAARSAADSADSADSAARSAALSAAWSAVDSAAWSAERSAAESAAWSAADSAARNAQRDKLIEMILEEEKKNI